MKPFMLNNIESVQSKYFMLTNDINQICYSLNTQRTHNQHNQ